MKSPNEVPSAAEFGLLVAYLAKGGVKISDVRKRIGFAPNGRTRAQIAAEIRAWLVLGVA